MVNRVTDNETFWKTIKFFLTPKGTNTNKITVVDKNKVISDDEQLAKLLVTFFKRRGGL